MKIGLQLYTVKEDCRRALLGTLRQVATMGYDGVEFAGYHGVPVDETRHVLDETGLAVAGTVYKMQQMAVDIASAIAECKALGSPAMVFPWLDPQYRDGAGAYRATAEILNDFGRVCRENNLRFLYHIHGYEFERFAEGTGLDLLVEHTAPENVGLELDTYWVAHGGADPVEVFRQHAARCPYLHLKDARNATDWFDTEVGDGIIDFPTLLRDALEHDVAWAIVEQEKFTMPPLESAAINCRNVQRLLKQIKAE